jgi:hypothetical protein
MDSRQVQTTDAIQQLTTLDGDFTDEELMTDSRNFHRHPGLGQQRNFTAQEFAERLGTSRHETKA